MDGRETTLKTLLDREMIDSIMDCPKCKQIGSVHENRKLKECINISELFYSGLAPRILLLNLKRVVIIQSTKAKKKLHNEVEIPSCLEYDINGLSVRFKLYAATLHQGKSSESGHYIAYIRNTDSDSKWVKVS